MTKQLRFGPAMTAIALATVIAGCATPQSGVRSSFGGRDGKSNVGLATRALAALNANDFATAVSFGERAVEKSPNDAGFRALLGNAYFGSGRFASAESAYRDALALYPDQPQAVLKLALVQIAQGRNAEALSVLGQARGMLEPADFGLAMALAGQHQEAVTVLESAARVVGADARVRQNLALAYALSGDWTAARTVAAQDLSADLIDARIQQWMAFAKPARAADQVAALTGVTPAASDSGQPARLALRPTETRTAQAAPPVQAEPVVAAAQPVVEQAFEPQFDQLAAAPAPEPVPAAIVQAPEPVFEAPQPAPAPVLTSSVTVKLPAARPASFSGKRPSLRTAAHVRRQGKSTAVVQLGAYGSPQRVAAAWNTAARRYSVLRGYSPMSARFNSSKGVVYRLAVKGFASSNEAARLCLALRRQGTGCFVRSVAGDVPVRFASR